MQIYQRTIKMREKFVDTLARLYEYSTTAFSKEKFTQWGDSDDEGYTYGSFKEKCDGISKLLTQYGVGVGDKVAIFSQSMPNWSVAFFSAAAFGRIAIPILPDSSENEVTNIINHSESQVLFVSRRVVSKVNEGIKAKLKLIIDLDSLEVIKSDDDKFTCDGRAAVPTPDDIATIIYTSGTTGSAKGVVLSHRNLASNVITCLHSCKKSRNDVWLSLLPLAHTLEMTIGLLYPMFCGASIYYLQKPPVPALLLKAIKTVRPTVILSVPLIIEKIYKGSVLPTINGSRTLRWMDKHANLLMCRLIGLKLKSTFGGRLRFFGIGGAKLDGEVEKFLLKSGFPYAVGYGLTETAPLITNACVGKTKVGSIGVPAYNVQVKLDNINPETGEGEIVAKGDNVMLGYYKDPERTRQVLSDDGWFRTNDLACMDENGRFYIKGRLNNMILGPSGENIYPEEIEQVINNFGGVNESLVMERDGKLVALVKFDDNVLNWNQETEDKFFENLQAKKKAVLDYVNKHVGKSSKVNSVEVVKEDFEKTATHKIRRFKYQDAHGDEPQQPDSSKTE